MQTLLLIAILILVTGCGSLVPKESQKSQSVQSTEALAVEQERTIRRITEVGPQAAAAMHRPAVVKAGLSGPKDETVVAIPLGAPMREDLTYTSTTKTGAGSSAQAIGTSESSIPMGVKIALLGIGVAILVAALAFAWKAIKGTGIGQGIALADDLLANIIQSKRNESTTSTDTVHITKIQTEIADLEAKRGKLRTKM